MKWRRAAVCFGNATLCLQFVDWLLFHCVLRGSFLLCFNRKAYLCSGQEVRTEVQRLSISPASEPITASAREIR